MVLSLRFNPHLAFSATSNKGEFESRQHKAQRSLTADLSAEAPPLKRASAFGELAPRGVSHFKDDLPAHKRFSLSTGVTGSAPFEASDEVTDAGGSKSASRSRRTEKRAETRRATKEASKTSRQSGTSSSGGAGGGDGEKPGKTPAKSHAAPPTRPALTPEQLQTAREIATDFVNVTQTILGRDLTQIQPNEINPIRTRLRRLSDRAAQLTREAGAALGPDHPVRRVSRALAGPLSVLNALHTLQTSQINQYDD